MAVTLCLDKLLVEILSEFCIISDKSYVAVVLLQFSNQGDPYFP